jgi:hypothetical protein
MSNKKWAWIVGIVPVVLKVALVAFDPSFTFGLSLALELAIKN